MTGANIEEAAQGRMLRPPLNRAMRVLERSLFEKNIPVLTAAIPDVKQIASTRKLLSKDIITGSERLETVQVVKDDQGVQQKALVLAEGIRKNDTSTWSPILAELVKDTKVKLVDHIIKVDYDFWNYGEIMDSIIPENEQEETPHGFNQVGHIAHLNIRENFQSLKYLIAEVIRDKNPRVKTVINKIDDVGADNEFRTFNYEVLAGSPDMNVEVSHQGCVFHFDYSKVYWNTKLQSEHLRIIDMFKPGEAVADVMAGVGPFAVPAGKKHCFVWGNDLNPDCFTSLEDAIKRNRVTQFVTPFNQDGHHFIKTAPQQLLQSSFEADITPKQPRNVKRVLQRKTMARPNTFSHFVMNLPATALTFLPDFKGIYAEQESLFAPHTSTKLPLIHVYCFQSIADGDDAAKRDICKQVSEQIGHEIRLGHFDSDDEASILDVRDVSPSKHMFCTTFRLPSKVAFAPA